MTPPAPHSARIAELSYFSKFALICAVGSGALTLAFAVWLGFNGGNFGSSLSGSLTTATLSLIVYGQCRARIQRLQLAPQPVIAQPREPDRG